MWMHGSSARPADRGELTAGWRQPVALATIALVAACSPPEATTQPPLRPFVQARPGPDATSMETREQRILEEYARSGQIPMDEPVVGEVPDGEPPIGDDILGELVPDPGEEAEGADEPGALPDPEGAFHVATPEGLGAEVFRAMVNQDAAHFDQLLIDSPGLQALAKVKETTATKRVQKLRNASHKSFRLFGVKKMSEAPEGGMASKLVYVRTRIGKGATIWGKEPRRGEETVQYWNNAVVFRLARSEEAIGPAVPTLEEEDDEDSNDGTYFELALGRMLKTPNGAWRLAAAPSASGPFHVWLRAGFHLKSEMLMPEHHPFPLSVGNFWRYRVRRTGEDTPDDVLDATSEEIRIEVTEVEKYDGYRVVSLRRTHTQERKKVTNQRLLVTPRRLYFCTSYCKYKGKDLGYVLGYVRINTPLLVFPTEPGMGWRTGGRRPTSSSGATYNIREALEDVTVPAGQFAETLAVTGKREVRWFKPGVGIVQRQVQTESGTRTQELLEYRVLTTE
jgi:hypothetical protein